MAKIVFTRFLYYLLLMDIKNGKKALQYFGIFNLRCSEKELKKRYFEKIKNLHPDFHSNESITLQNKYKNDFLETHKNYQIAISFIRRTKERVYDQKHQQDNPNCKKKEAFTSFYNFNNFYKNKNWVFSFDLIFSYLNYTFHNVYRKKILLLKTKYFLLFFPLFVYFLLIIHEKNENIEKRNTETTKEYLDTKEKRMTPYEKNKTSEEKEYIGIDKKNNHSRNETKPLSKNRYIYNVVKQNKNIKEDDTYQKDTRNVIEKEPKHSEINNHVKFIKTDILMNSLDLKKKASSYFSFVPKKSSNINYQKKHTVQAFSNLFKNVTDPDSLILNIKAYEKNEKKNKISIKKKSEAKEKRKKQKSVFQKVNLPLYEEFLKNGNSRGEHNESRYINGIGGICGGYCLIKDDQKQNRADDFILKDFMYIKKLKNKQLIEKAMKLQDLIIYEKKDYINFFDPLKRTSYNEKINVQLNNELKYRNCVIPLKECAFEKKMKNMEPQKTIVVNTGEQTIVEADETGS